MKKPDRWVIGNWKMNGTRAANEGLLAAITSVKRDDQSAVKIAVCPPFPYLSMTTDQLSESRIHVGAQDVSDHVSGAYTGQVAAGMLKDLGVSLALVGHSERRQYNGESSDLVARKARAAIEAGLIAVICVGETLAERDAGAAEKVVEAQLAPCRELIASAGHDAPARIVLAYEPVWAIGTGKNAGPEEAQAMHAFIRRWLGGISAAATMVSVLYGGSVKAANAAELFSQPDIDGGLIGGASLVAGEFMSIVASAR